MGAEVMYGREARARFQESLAPEKADNQVMGLSVLWYAKKADQPTPFPDIDWGIPFHEGNAYYIRKGGWEWETGQYRNQAEETEYIRDYGLMVTYANWSFLKNRSQRKAQWAQDVLSWVSPLGGKRESYRVVGDHILTQNDIEQHIPYTDATGAMTWNLDLHFPDPENEKKFAEPFRSCAYHRGIIEPYPVPYRCLYARDVKNLFLGGRDISTSHVAFSCVRVMRTLGMLGEVIGLAATVCRRENAYPRDVYTTHFAKLKALMERGVPVPSPYHAYGCDASESYHFEELGFVPAQPKANQAIATGAANQVVKVQHKVTRMSRINRRVSSILSSRHQPRRCGRNMARSDKAPLVAARRNLCPSRDIPAETGYDLVAGGGPAGVAAAISAGRLAPKCSWWKLPVAWAAWPPGMMMSFCPSATARCLAGGLMNCRDPLPPRFKPGIQADAWCKRFAWIPFNAEGLKLVPMSDRTAAWKSACLPRSSTWM